MEKSKFKWCELLISKQKKTSLTTAVYIYFFSFLQSLEIQRLYSTSYCMCYVHVYKSSTTGITKAYCSICDYAIKFL